MVFARIAVFLLSLACHGAVGIRRNSSATASPSRSASLKDGDPPRKRRESSSLKIRTADPGNAERPITPPATQPRRHGSLLSKLRRSSADPPNGSRRPSATNLDVAAEDDDSDAERPITPPATQPPRRRSSLIRWLQHKLADPPNGSRRPSATNLDVAAEDDDSDAERPITPPATQPRRRSSLIRWLQHKLAGPPNGSRRPSATNLDVAAEKKKQAQYFKDLPFDTQKFILMSVDDPVFRGELFDGLPAPIKEKLDVDLGAKYGIIWYWRHLGGFEEAKANTHRQIPGSEMFIDFSEIDPATGAPKVQYLSESEAIDNFMDLTPERRGKQFLSMSKRTREVYLSRIPAEERDRLNGSVNHDTEQLHLVIFG